MILSDREVRTAIERGLFFLSPLPSRTTGRWSPAAVDLALDAEIRPWEQLPGTTAERIIDPAAATFRVSDLIEQHTRREDCTHGFVLAPQKLVLGWTMERLQLPYRSRIAARVEGKSSLARIGLGIHVTAPTIHPGFGVDPGKPNYPGSPIRLEIWNAGPNEIRLTKGMAICQIIFEEVHGTPEEGYTGQFGVQGPQDSPSPRKRNKKK